MNHRCAILPRTTLLFCAFLPIAAAASAQGYKVETASLPAPQELAAPVRGTLSGDALRVTGPQGALCEIWFRKDIPAKAASGSGLGIAFPQFGDGALVGAIRFEAASQDYRQQAIQPGVYTLRYALQPVDGNHQGVSPYRDFLLAIPAAADSSVEPLAGKDLYKASRKAAGTGHPSVWSLYPPDNAPPSLPGIVHQNDGDLWILYVKAPLASGSGGSSTVGLVLVGHAPEA
ncbi:MAG: hypothetical protein WBC04_04040 [Candidatus Acidiferrales bacterium]